MTTTVMEAKRVTIPVNFLVMFDYRLLLFLELLPNFLKNGVVNVVTT